MLVLKRKTDQKVYIGDNITVSILAITKTDVKLGIAAPPGVTILREELSARPVKQERPQETAGEGFGVIEYLI